LAIIGPNFTIRRAGAHNNSGWVFGITLPLVPAMMSSEYRFARATGPRCVTCVHGARMYVCA
jgi:hypothetical protein